MGAVWHFLCPECETMMCHQEATAVLGLTLSGLHATPLQRAQHLLFSSNEF